MNRAKPKEITTKKPLADVPRAPSWLSKDGKREWRRVAPILIERKTLTEGDLGALASYCTAVARVAECERVIAKEGLFAGARRHPAVTIQDAASKTARQLATEFGLTPISRSRPAIRDEDHDSDNDSDLGL